MKMTRLRDWLSLRPAAPAARPPADPLDIGLLNTGQKEEMENAISILEDDNGALDKKAQREAERTVQTAAEDTLKKLRMVQMGRCPACGEPLNRHLFATVCDACGWHDFEEPRNGPVRIHLRNRPDPIEGDRCYLVKPDAILLLRNDAVVAKVNRDAAAWIEYVWTPEEIDQRHRRILDQMTLLCGWCNQACDAEKDGFHAVQIAFGSAQERYTFCSDDCYEAFRRTYPPRVHRDCYERNCADCNLCLKRYDDENEGIQLLAKDYLKPPRKKD